MQERVQRTRVFTPSNTSKRTVQLDRRFRIRSTGRHTAGPDYLRKNVLYEALNAAGIKPGYGSHGFHLFRHSAGSIVHSITRDVKTTQELLGIHVLARQPTSTPTSTRAVGEEASEALALAIIPDQDIALASERIQ